MIFRQDNLTTACSLLVMHVGNAPLLRAIFSKPSWSLARVCGDRSVMLTFLGDMLLVRERWPCNTVRLMQVI